ncbi:TPA: hypothetical protein G9F27_005571 [Salmonella enterica]|uniref:Zona occludens toxin N-terminal domain-containing protein n=2 Tax=Salmonella enterica TaxID=28901 RepID=A0A743PB40_SALER|nr:hypothetical protein [Salmonella enterica]
MAVKWVTGKLGAGKGLYCDYEMQKYYKQGRRVVTNYPVDTHLLDSESSNPVTVLPCHPRAEDLHALGRGCPASEKEKFGAVFLDEAGTWLNSRTYADKTRLSLIDWFIHSRHLGWDVFIIVQNEEMIDKQIALALGEILVVCKRSDRARSVFIKMIGKLLSGNNEDNKKVKPARRKGLFRHRVLVETYHERKSKRDKPFEKFSFYADWYFGFHDTNFIFDNGFEVLTYPNGKVKTVDMRCMYSLLPGKYIKKWYHADDAVVKEPALSKGQLFSALFFTAGSVLCWYFMIHSKKQESEVISSGSVVLHQAAGSYASVGNIGTESLPPLPPPPPVLSSTWRLTGYLKSASGLPRYVIRDNAGNVRYIASDEPWNGSYSEIVVDGERVTFWTGNARSGNDSRDFSQSVPDPFSSAAGSAMSALGIGDSSR